VLWFCAGEREREQGWLGTGRRRRRGKEEETAKCEVYFEAIIKVYFEAIMAVLDSRLESCQSGRLPGLSRNGAS